MSEGTQSYEVLKTGEPPTVEAPTVELPAKNGKRDTGMLSAADLADRSRFDFRYEVVELPEIGGKIKLKSLSVEEREMLPDLRKLSEEDDVGKRTEGAIKAAAFTFALIVAEPKVTAEEAEKFLGDWPAKAYDRVNEAYDKLLGGGEEEKAAYREFPERKD